jgi:PAS domain S-box-containing protein
MMEVSVALVSYKGKDAALAFFRDITESARIQSALKESESRFKAIFENAPVGIKIVDALSSKIVAINRAGETMIGIPRDKIIDRECWEFVCPESKGSCPVMNSEKGLSNREIAITGPSGQSIQLTKTTVPFSLEEKKYLIDIFVDISDHKKAAAELKKAHREKDQLIRSIPSMLIGVTSEGLVSQCNPVIERIFGISAADILYRPFSQSGIQWDWSRIDAAVADCLSKQNNLVSLEKVRFTRPDGKEGFLGLTFTPVESKETRKPGFLVIGADITNRITLELQLAQARKLEAIGQLAAGIAHEINTPTQYINDNILFFRDAFNDMKPVLQHYRELPEKLTKEGLT